eukprot:4528465-Amphidinium_carterae.1
MDWSAVVHDTVRYGQTGIHMAATQEEAVQLAKKLKGTPVPYALLSTQPLSQARSTEACTFRVQQTDAQKVVRCTILTGFLSQFGEEAVVHKYRVRTLNTTTHNATKWSTMVITLNAKSGQLTDEEWKKLRKVTTLKDLHSLVAAQRLQATDIFRIQCTDSEFKAHVRIRQDDLWPWMVEPCPFTIGLLGDATEDFRIVWDDLIPTLAAMRESYTHTPGFAGIVSSTRSLGIRVTAESHQDALEFLGKPVGEVYLLRGFPLDASEITVEDILIELDWPGVIIEGTRRVFWRYASFKVRAPFAPPLDTVQFKMAGTLYQVHIELVRPTSRKPAVIRPTQEIRTWSEAAKNTFGAQVPTSAHAVPTDDEESQHDCDVDEHNDKAGTDCDVNMQNDGEFGE